MRITFVCDLADFTGGNRVIAEHARRLSERGHEVLAVSRARIPPTLGERARAAARLRAAPGLRAPGVSHFQLLGVEHRVIPSSRPVSERDVPDGDVVVATWWRTARWVAGLPARKGAKAYFMQDYGGAGQPEGRVAATFRLPLEIVTISPFLAGFVRERSGRESHLVMNAVDLGVFRGEPRGRNARFTVGTLISRAPQKGSDVCVRAMEAIREREPGARFVCFGKQPRAGWVRSLSWLERHGTVPDETAAELYRSCDAWLFGSRREGFGLPVLEAMACRTPVVATPAGAAPELVAGGGGVLVRGEDPEGMAGAALGVWRGPEEAWREMSEAAHRTAAGWTWDEASLAFERALEAAVAASGRGRRTGWGVGRGAGWGAVRPRGAVRERSVAGV